MAMGYTQNIGFHRLVLTNYLPVSTFLLEWIHKQTRQRLSRYQRQRHHDGTTESKRTTDHNQNTINQRKQKKQAKTQPSCFIHRIYLYFQPRVLSMSHHHPLRRLYTSRFHHQNTIRFISISISTQHRCRNIVQPGSKVTEKEKDRRHSDKATHTHQQQGNSYHVSVE